MFSVGSGVEGVFRGLAWPFMFVVLVGVSCLAASAACLRVRTLGEPFIMYIGLAVRPCSWLIYYSISLRQYAVDVQRSLISSAISASTGKRISSEIVVGYSEGRTQLWYTDSKDTQGW